MVGDREPEFEEILGHHLEQAYRYRRELGVPDERSAALAIQGGQRLASSGRRALDRRDVPAAVKLLRRAAAVLPEDHSMRPTLMNDFAQALIDNGDLRAAGEVLNQVKTLAGDPSGGAHAELSH
jgi:hypothetical protein